MKCDRNFLSVEFFGFPIFFLLVFVQRSKAKFYVLAGCNFAVLLACFIILGVNIALSSSKCKFYNCGAFLFSVFINDQRSLRLQSEKVARKVHNFGAANSMFYTLLATSKTNSWFTLFYKLNKSFFSIVYLDCHLSLELMILKQ